MPLILDVQRVTESNDPPDEDRLRCWAEATLRACGQDGGELTLRIVDTAESHELNHRYRDKNQPTNVLSFPFEAPVGLPADALDPILGDLVICSPVVTQEAQQQGKSLEAHWAHMVVHGVLHLLGHDHQNNDDAEHMESLETRILTQLSFPPPYASQSIRNETDHA